MRRKIPDRKLVVWYFSAYFVLAGDSRGWKGDDRRMIGTERGLTGWEDCVMVERRGIGEVFCGVAGEG